MALPISQSGLWKIQLDYYQSLGPSAWDDKTPYYITNSKVISETYADLLISFYLDQALDPSQPLYILELGSGTGRLAYHLTRELARKWSYFPQLAALEPVVVLSDIVEANLKSWKKHAGFQALGSRVDFALIGLGQENQVFLQDRQIHLKDLVNPLVVIANYVFDSLPHDEFLSQDGQVHECLIEVVPKSERPNSSPDRLDIRDVEIVRSYRPVEQISQYYSQPRAQAALNFYTNSLVQGSFTIPLGGLETLDRLRQLGKIALLSSDRGFSDPQSMTAYPNHPIALHAGCFSHMVNYHALGFGFETRLATRRNLLDGVQTYFFSQFPLGPQLNYAFRERFERANAINHTKEIFSLVRDENEPTRGETDYAPRFKAILGFVKLNLNDPNSFTASAKKLSELIGSLNYGEHREVVTMLEQVWENDFHFKGAPNVTFWMAHIYSTLGYFAKGLEFLELTQQRQGPDGMLYYLKGTLNQALGQRELAAQFYRQSLELQPEIAEAQEALDSLLAQETATQAT